MKNKTFTETSYLGTSCNIVIYGHGNCDITSVDGNHIQIATQDLLDFVADYIKIQKIESIKSMTTKEVLKESIDFL